MVPRGTRREGEKVFTDFRTLSTDDSRLTTN